MYFFLFLYENIYCWYSSAYISTHNMFFFVVIVLFFCGEIRKISNLSIEKKKKKMSGAMIYSGGATRKRSLGVKKKKCIATDKAFFFIRKILISFSFLHENICCGYPLEASWRGASNEYPQHMFSWRNEKNIMWIPPLICSYENSCVRPCSKHPTLLFFYQYKCKIKK